MKVCADCKYYKKVPYSEEDDDGPTSELYSHVCTHTTSRHWITGVPRPCVNVREKNHGDECGHTAHWFEERTTK